MPIIIPGANVAELKESAVYAATCDELGITISDDLVQAVIGTTTEELVPRPTEDGELRREAVAMSPTCRLAANELVKSVIDQLLPDQKYYLARNRWSLFNINYYEQGDRNPMHIDFAEPQSDTMVVILSLSGVRRLEVRDHPPIQLKPKMLAFLDGGKNPRHAAECIDGPSISVVADVPNLWH